MCYFGYYLPSKNNELLKQGITDIERVAITNEETYDPSVYGDADYGFFLETGEFILYNTESLGYFNADGEWVYFNSDQDGYTMGLFDFKNYFKDYCDTDAVLEGLKEGDTFTLTIDAIMRDYKTKFTFLGDKIFIKYKRDSLGRVVNPNPVTNTTPPHWFFEDNYEGIKPPIRTTHSRLNNKGDTSKDNALMVKDGQLTTKYEYTPPNRHPTVFDKNSKGLVDGKTACGQFHIWYLLNNGVSRADIDFEAYGLTDEVATLVSESSELAFKTMTPVSVYFSDEAPEVYKVDTEHDIGRHLLITFKETSNDYLCVRESVLNLPTAVFVTADGNEYELLGYNASNTTSTPIDGCNTYAVGILPIEALRKVEQGQTYKIKFKDDGKVKVNNNELTLTKERR